MSELTCRACRGRHGHLVLDLGNQPACDFFPSRDAPGPDPVYPLQMYLCARCGLAQLAADPTVPQEPKGVEPAALVTQAREAVRQVSAAGLLTAGARVAEYGSPHGGSWVELLEEQGMTVAADAARADIVLDCFGLMHAPDQAAALAERAARVAQGGVLLLQYHSLDTIVRRGQWNALRHGHYAYYSATALSAMLAAVGFSLTASWRFDLYGGTTLLAARRGKDVPGGSDATVRELIAKEARWGVCDPAVLRTLQAEVATSAAALHGWLAAGKSAGRRILGYGAASRAVALLRVADASHGLLAAIADASPAKQGLRMPGTGIPVISPAELVAHRPDAVLVLVPDLVQELRAAYPEIEAHGGRWVAVDTIPFGYAVSPISREIT